MIEFLRNLACAKILKSLAHPLYAIPSSIRESFENCASREKNLLKILEPEQGASSTFTGTLRLSLLKKDLKRCYGMFRESVLLLRDLCSEYEPLILTIYGLR
jgi:hypothetical protein